jgi:hypothetical protein
VQVILNLRRICPVARIFGVFVAPTLQRRTLRICFVSLMYVVPLTYCPSHVLLDPTLTLFPQSDSCVGVECPTSHTACSVIRNGDLDLVQARPRPQDKYRRSKKLARPGRRRT